MAEPSLRGKTVVLGVSGGIAAYKAAELVRLLRKAEARVRVILTKAAQHFITPLTLSALSGEKVATDLFDLTEESEIGHIQLADGADLLLIAPATADVIGKLALGLADDVLTTVALATRAPMLVAPAMNVNMWEHVQVQDNLRRLVARGVATCGPDAGPLACGWIGKGRLVDPQVIFEAAERILLGTGNAAGILANQRVLITAGPTYEALDPVRFLGNRSSGKMGFALARAAVSLGAHVTLVAGPVALSTPAGVTRVDVESASEMADEVLPKVAAGEVDVVIMAAAVADYQAEEVARDKLKKGAVGEEMLLRLKRTVDILREAGKLRRGHQPLLVGFAAETKDVEAYAQQKLESKGCDLIVANDVAEPGSGFGVDTNRITLLTPKKPIERLPLLSKDEAALRILHRVASLLYPDGH